MLFYPLFLTLHSLSDLFFNASHLCLFPTVSPTCPLERLILRNADVDDFECERFVEAIKNNKSLVELDLSNNKIGSAENLNTVMPDLVTGVRTSYVNNFLVVSSLLARVNSARRRDLV